MFTGITGDLEWKSVTGQRAEPKFSCQFNNEDIAAFVQHRVPLTSCRAILTHLISCEKCRRIVSEVAASLSVVNDPEESS